MKDANKEIKGKGGMKAEEEQEAAARFLSPSVSLAISSRDGGERQRERGRVCCRSPWRRPLSPRCCLHTQTVFALAASGTPPRRRRHDAQVISAARCNLSGGARGGAGRWGVGGLLRDPVLRGPLQRRPNANLWIWDGVTAPSRNLRSCWSR